MIQYLFHPQIAQLFLFIFLVGFEDLLLHLPLSLELDSRVVEQSILPILSLHQVLIVLLDCGVLVVAVVPLVFSPFLRFVLHTKVQFVLKLLFLSERSLIPLFLLNLSV
jgi:hypothetical protein